LRKSRGSLNEQTGRMLNSHNSAANAATLESVRCCYLTLCVEFLREIGLGVHFRRGASGFCPGVDISNGQLMIDPEVAYASVVLHEAGHLAIVPDRYRSLLQSNVDEGVNAMLEEVCSMGLPPDHPLYRAAIQTSDPEATAWAWAAGTHLGLPGPEIIRDDEYDGGGAEIRLMLAAGRYLGIHGLAHAGFCHVPSYMARANGIEAVFPRLRRWLQGGSELEVTESMESAIEA